LRRFLPENQHSRLVGRAIVDDTMLAEIEATFRSLKTGLGLRPVYHQKEDRNW